MWEGEWQNALVEAGRRQLGKAGEVREVGGPAGGQDGRGAGLAVDVEVTLAPPCILIFYSTTEDH